MSTVFYRWGAGKDESRVTFDGTHISVFDFKREVILNNRMGNGKDFDLGVFDNVTGEEIKDDNHLIARSSSLVVRRMPASLGKNRGTAQNYIVGTLAADALGNEHRIEASAKQALLDKQNRRAGVPGIGGAGGAGSISRRFDGKGDEAIGNAQAIGSGGAPVISTGNEEEDRRIAAFFEQSGDQWERTQEDMSMAPGRQQQFRNRATSSRPGIPGSGAGAGPSGGAGGAGGSAGRFDYSLPPDREPPVGYICYRCGQKGHWIQSCPINDDPSASDRKRFNRVTGIPRSFLKTVEAPNTGEGSSGGAMLTADGGFVMAMPDQRQWQKQQSIKRRAQNDLADLPYPPELTCPLDRRLFADAVKVPCCGTTYCEECITTHLVEHDFECPACESKVASLKRLKRDEDVRERVEEWKEENEGEGDAKQEPEERGTGGEGEGEARAGETSGEVDKPAGHEGREKEEEEQDVKPDIFAADPAALNAQEGQGEEQVKKEPQDGVADTATHITNAQQAEEAQSEPEEGAASPTKPSGPVSNAPSGPSADRAKSAKNGAAQEEQPRPAAIASLDPNKMQEMLDPQTMQIYLTQIQKMLLNPVVKPEARALLIAQRQLVQATVMQMQLAGMDPSNASGGVNGNRQSGPVQHMNGQQQNPQANMGMGMQGMMAPDMGMGMGMNMMGNMGNMGGMMGNMAGPNQMQQIQQMQQMEQMMLMNMGNMGNMGNMPNMNGGMGDAGMQNMQAQGQGMGGMHANVQNGNFQQSGANFGPGNRGGRGGFQRGGPVQGFRGRGRGRGGMGMGMGMGTGINTGFGPGQQGPMGMKRAVEDGYEGPEGKMARVG